MKRWITAATVSLAALLALTACGGPVAPAPDSSQIPSAAGTAPRSTEPVTTASASAATTVPAESKTTDSSGDGYGGGPSSYMSLYLPEFTISGIFSDLVDHDDYVAWSNKANSQWQADDEVNHPPRTPVDFIREFNISKETFTQANFTIPEYAPFTQEEIDIIYSFDLTRINAHFGNPDAVILGENIYPMVWFEKNPVEEWAARDIPVQMVEQAFQKFAPDLSDGTKNLLQGKIDAYKAM